MNATPDAPTPTADPLDDQALIARCQATLRANDRGGYSVPSARLYPFQWNWDAAVNAVGWQTFDEARAWQEVDCLLRGQWRNGMVPSIVFHQPADSYFPGPGEWGCADLSPPTTSISQPPLLASMVRRMHRDSRWPGVDAHVRALLPQLLAWHRWWHTDRDPEGTGLSVTYHPWETGSDNSPAWDAPLAAVPPATRSYQRRDTGIVDGSMRPHQAEYDRFVYLLDFFRDQGFDAQRIYAECPLRIVDFGLNAILHRADADLAALCLELGLADEAAQVHAWHARSAQALHGLWSATLQRHVSLDTRRGQALMQHTHAAQLAWWAGLVQGPIGGERAPVLAAQLRQSLGETAHGLVSCARNEPGWDPRRYWRGPVWPHINWLVAQGLAEHGETELARQVNQGTLQLIRQGGLFEYFEPDTGEGLGGPDFSWTAAIALLLVAG